MKRVISFVMALALTFGAFSSTLAQGIFSDLASVGVIEVNGRGEMMVDPDEFKLSIVIDEQLSKETFDELESQMIKALSDVGVDRKNILLGNVSSTTSQKRRSTTTSAAYQLTLSSAVMVQDCFAALKGLGITRVSLIETSNSEIEKYQSQVRKLAVQDAQAKAAELAETLGLKVGNCTSIKEYGNYSNYNVQPIMMRSSYGANSMAAAAADSSEPWEFTKIKVQSSVDAVFSSFLKKAK